MGLFRKKHQLKNEYDHKLITLIKKQRQLYEADSHLEKMMVKENPEWESQSKLQKAKYFYLFKEARIRQLKGDHLK
ncbi:MAG: YaaL family protein [Alkalibacterium sp.]|nr:YaaL family protein [Alkalibacterium sp.]